ncbi:MAG: YbhB/YbcL family Raf kinase inhibitor-like protein [Candidatus Omnitrophota bacterium]
MKKIIAAAIFVLAILQGVNFAEGGASMRISSPEFENNQVMPKRLSCQGEDVNPLLIIDGVPKEAKALVLIVDDPDAPVGTWVHWVVYDIPVIGRIEENSVPGKQGANSAGKKDYHGPCPPSGTHRYFFKIYALDKILNLDEGLTKEQLEQAIEGHILDRAQLVGLYKKYK